VATAVATGSTDVPYEPPTGHGRTEPVPRTGAWPEELDPLGRRPAAAPETGAVPGAAASEQADLPGSGRASGRLGPSGAYQPPVVFGPTPPTAPLAPVPSNGVSAAVARPHGDDERGPVATDFDHLVAAVAARLRSFSLLGRPAVTTTLTDPELGTLRLTVAGRAGEVLSVVLSVANDHAAAVLQGLLDRAAAEGTLAAGLHIQIRHPARETADGHGGSTPAGEGGLSQGAAGHAGSDPGGGFGTRSRPREGEDRSPTVTQPVNGVGGWGRRGRAVRSSPPVAASRRPAGRIDLWA
jgi:hypothetical protein